MFTKHQLHTPQDSQPWLLKCGATKGLLSVFYNREPNGTLTLAISESFLVFLGTTGRTVVVLSWLQLLDESTMVPLWNTSSSISSLDLGLNKSPPFVAWSAAIVICLTPWVTSSF